jgi:Peroxiredoxin
MLRLKRGPEQGPSVRGVVQVGDPVPDLELETTAGKIRLSQLRGKKVVLYFFPKAFTMGCTRELKRFAELYEEFRKAGAEVIGVSVDGLETQRRFAEKYGARFPLGFSSHIGCCLTVIASSLFPRTPLGASSGLGAFRATPGTPHLERSFTYLPYTLIAVTTYKTI